MVWSLLRCTHVELGHDEGSLRVFGVVYLVDVFSSVVTVRAELISGLYTAVQPCYRKTLSLASLEP